MADTAATKLLGMVFFLVLISQGYGYCTIHSLSVAQTQTGVKVQGKPEWSVSITNNCLCNQSSVLLDCRGFQTVEKLNPYVLYTKDNATVCLIKYSNPIVYREVFKFTYAWDKAFPLTPVSSKYCLSSSKLIHFG
ncbi:uncharacterized protein LOC130713361 [Lotus japonicus]|uniref:uncharacterized protein LOC130713361 n=1 Tax=Lotus japonicus TaxID=34305 RepID=UPI0025846B86|nr:uncharacterized protein LOC130713361 [Lotus japonicus]